jgi:hypothetical protein
MLEATDIIRAQNYFMGVSEGNSVGINAAWPLIRSIQGVGIWIYKNGSNNEIDMSLRTVTGGTSTERIRILAGGNVGIGTSTPAALFTAYLAAGGSRPVAIGSGDVYMTLGQDAAGGTNGSVIQCYSGGNSSTIGTSAYRLLLQPYGSSVVIGGTADNGNRLQVNGVSNFTSSVGIGTASPGYILDIGGFASSAQTLRVAATSSISSIRLMEANDSYGFSFQNINASRLGIFRHSASVGGTEVISILRDTGLVGIGGITNPTKPLVVNRIAGGGNNNPAIMIGNNGIGGGLRFQTYDLVADANAFMGLGTDMGIGTYEHSLVFPYGSNQGKQTIGSYDGTTFSTKMTILANGNVGIGVSPAYPLHVGITGGTSGSVKYWSFATPTISSYSGSFSASIYAALDVVTSGSFTAFSDQRAKVLESPLGESFSNLVQKIDVHQYSWINKVEKGDTKKIGFFAQEVEKILPDAVGKTTHVVPTIYREADSFTDTTITIKGHGLTTEKKIEVVDPENDKHVAEITRVIDSDTIEVTFEKKPKDKLFVIGPEVDDSRVINHDYIMAISFGAVKEIIEENKSLRNQISCLTSRLDALVEQLK